MSGLLFWLGVDRGEVYWDQMTGQDKQLAEWYAYREHVANHYRLACDVPLCYRPVDAVISLHSLCLEHVADYRNRMRIRSATKFVTPPSRGQTQGPTTAKELP